MAAKKRGSKTTKIGDAKGISAGRPKGAKNKTTLFKEAMKDGFEQKLMTEGYKVFDAVVAKAIGPPSTDDDGNIVYRDGDMTAAKMIMDRIVPVTKAVDLNANDLGKTGGVTIHIEKLVADTGRVGDTIEDGEVIDE